MNLPQRTKPFALGSFQPLITFGDHARLREGEGIAQAQFVSDQRALFCMNQRGKKSKKRAAESVLGLTISCQCAGSCNSQQCQCVVANQACTSACHKRNRGTMKCSSIRRKDNQDSAQQTAQPASFNAHQAVPIRLIPQPSEDRRHAPGVMWQPDLGMRGHSNSEELGSSSHAEAAGADSQVLANTAHSR